MSSAPVLLLYGPSEAQTRIRLILEAAGYPVLVARSALEGDLLTRGASPRAIVGATESPDHPSFARRILQEVQYADRVTGALAVSGPCSIPA
jgi:hypothetical protein